MNDLKELKDIKAIELISIDFTNYILGFVLLILMLAAVVVFFKTRNRKLTIEQKATKYLKELDFVKYEDKNLAYEFTLYGHKCLQKQYEDEFLRIINQLEKYKYKKEVEKIDADLIAQMKDYIRVRL
jgi:cell division protein FtsL